MPCGPPWHSGAGILELQAQVWVHTLAVRRPPHPPPQCRPSWPGRPPWLCPCRSGLRSMAPKPGFLGGLFPPVCPEDPICWEGLPAPSPPPSLWAPFPLPCTRDSDLQPCLGHEGRLCARVCGGTQGAWCWPGGHVTRSWLETWATHLPVHWEGLCCTILSL